MRWPHAVSSAIERRSQGRCEACGSVGPLELHHRKFASRGGKSTPANGLALCGWGNHTGCHGEAHTAPDATERGLSVHSWQEPSTQPVEHHAYGLVLLDDDGGWTPVEAVG